MSDNKTTVDVVTGGAGFIGSHLVDHLMVTTDHTVRVIDDFSRGTLTNLERHKGNDRLEIAVTDLRDGPSVSRYTDGADRIFHLAARADIVPSIHEPVDYFNTNVVGTLSIMEAARQHNVKKFIYAASSSCYGFPLAYPTDEDEPIQCVYPYALTKFMGEEMVLHWGRVYGVPVVSARLFNVYGPRSATRGSYGAMWGVFLSQMQAGAPLTVMGSGEQRRDFVFVTDVVEAFTTIAEKGEVGETYNVARGMPVSINEIIAELRYDNVVHLPARSGEPDLTWANTAKIEKLGWHAKVRLSEGVDIMLKNIDLYKNAPVWSPAGVTAATALWNECLS